jgi:hypothetical protein
VRPVSEPWASEKGVIVIRMGSFLLTVLAGCSTMTVEGLVVDGSGEALSKATVKANGTDCSAVTSDQGVFSLACEPGSLTLTIAHSTYFTHTAEMSAMERRSYSLPKTTLIKKPKEDGLYVFKNDAYIGLDSGRLKRSMTTSGPAKARTYCLDRETSAPNSIPAGTTRFVDHNADSWRLFRLDAQGCAYRDARDENGRWNVEYRDRPQLEREDIDDGMAILKGSLPKGEYFVADWGGFFVADPSEAGSYSGRWLRVDG